MSDSSISVLSDILESVSSSYVAVAFDRLRVRVGLLEDKTNTSGSLSFVSFEKYLLLFLFFCCTPVERGEIGFLFTPLFFEIAEDFLFLVTRDSFSEN